MCYDAASFKGKKKKRKALIYETERGEDAKRLNICD